MKHARQVMEAHIRPQLSTRRVKELRTRGKTTDDRNKDKCVHDKKGTLVHVTSMAREQRRCLSPDG